MPSADLSRPCCNYFPQHLLLSLILVSWVLAFAGCRPQQADEEEDRQTDMTSDLQRKVLEAVQPYLDNPERTVDELRKLRQVEYKVLTLPSNLSGDELTRRLNEMGKSNWDCFHIERAPAAQHETLLIFCKRGADTMLRYLPPGLL